MKHFTCIVILLSTFLAHSSDIVSNKCPTTFSSQNTRAKKLEGLLYRSIHKKVRARSLSRQKEIHAYDAIEDFIDFLDPETLDLKDMKNKDISQYKFADIRQSALDQEIQDSKVLENIEPYIFRKKFLYALHRTTIELQPHINKFLKLYTDNASFRKEIYKFEIFMKLFEGIFPHLLSHHALALVSPEWVTFFKKHGRQTFRNNDEKPDLNANIHEWRLRLQSFIRLTYTTEFQKTTQDKNL